MMKTNMSATDRIVRVFLTAVFGVLYFTHVVSGTLGYVLLALGGIFLLTSAMSFCPLYKLVGISTCATKKV